MWLDATTNRFTQYYKNIEMVMMEYLPHFAAWAPQISMHKIFCYNKRLCMTYFWDMISKHVLKTYSHALVIVVTQARV